MKKLFGAWAFALALSGCAALQDIANVVAGNSSQKITRTPIWVYKPDLLFGLGDKAFQGYAVTVLDQTDVKVWSAVDVDRVEVETCGRHDVCQIKGGELACDQGLFDVQKDWFGNADKTMTYHFAPNKVELDKRVCPSVHMMISIFDKNALAAWGFLMLRDTDGFAASMTCGKDWRYAGASPCSIKNGTIVEERFDAPVDNFRAESTCHLTRLSPTDFEMRPEVGWCRASFMVGQKFHDVLINGYDEALIRDGKE